ncbi:SGNH/GDSL hydrolase family protein [Bordetella muralis]|jgi:hypothetical protein|uniref:SGNH/GDSL hydrolase family protein n=1 Tax=Bordetella muralis TaxID=1649130 RepID=UPI0039EEFEE5
MNFLFVGGSNTLMQRGYVYQFEKLYKTFQNEEINIKNIAIGANSCVHGLELLKNENSLSGYDCIVVEYVVNDHKLAPSSTIDTWRQAYEGIIRFLIKNCSPEVRIISLILGRRDPKTFFRQKRLAKEIHGLSKKYSKYANVEVLDATKILWEISENRKDLYASMYKDGAHYSLPVAASLIGSLLLNHYVAGLQKGKIEFSSLESDQATNSFEHSVVIPARQFGAAHRLFKNSKLEVSALVIGAGNSVELDVPGSVVSFSFISTFDCLSVLVEEEGETPFFIDCRHKWVQADHSRFTLKNLPLAWKRWGSCVGRRKIRFTAIAEDVRANLTHKYVGQYAFAAPDPVPIDNAAFYLVSILSQNA